MGTLGLLGSELRNRTLRIELTRPSARRRRNVSYLIASLATMVALQIVSAYVRSLVPSFVDWSTVPVLQVAACFLVAELFYWAVHFVKHVSSTLWRFHFQHHRERHFDMWLVAHVHGFEVLVGSAIAAALLAALGFELWVIQLYMLFFSLANFYQHSSHDLSLGWLDHIIVNPAYHRIHHGVTERGNYGHTLTVWDVVFRTARWPVPGEVVATGIEENGEPFGFWTEMLYPFAPSFAQRLAARRPRTKDQVASSTASA